MDSRPPSNPNSDTFRFCPGCGREALAPDSVKSFECNACGFLFFVNCAAGAMAVILDDRDRVLVTRRARNPARGSLDLPGGFAEPGEGIEASLKREIKEELNLEVTTLSYLGSFFNAYPYASVVYPVTDLVFLCKVASFAPIRAMDDVDGFRFIPVPEIDPGAFGMASARQAIAHFKQVFKGRTGTGSTALKSG